MIKVIGIVLIVLGLILFIGSFGSVGAYGATVPVFMLLVVSIGFLLVFWNKVRLWLKPKSKDIKNIIEDPLPNTPLENKNIQNSYTSPNLGDLNIPEITGPDTNTNGQN